MKKHQLLSDKPKRQTSRFSMVAILSLFILLASAVSAFAVNTSTLAGGGNSAAATCAPATNVLIYSFNVATGTTALQANAVNFTTTGTAVSGTDITNFTVWVNSSNTLTGATNVGNITTGLGAGAHTVSVGSTAMKKSTTFFLFITATFPSTAVNGHTVAVSAMTNAAGVPITFAANPTSFSGTATAGGTQTINSAGIISGASFLCGTSSTTTQFSDGTTGGAWSSSSTPVATVSGTGLVSGVSTGATTISYTLGSCYTTQSFGYASSIPATISGPSTVCPPLPVTLLSESFEGGSFPPAGWNNSGATAIWSQAYAPSTNYPACSAAEDGDYVALMDFFDNVSGNQLLYTPPISMVNIVGGQVSFWLYRDVGYYPYSCGFAAEGVTVYFNTSPAAAGTTLGFVPRAADGPTTGSLVGNSTPYSSGWYQYTASIPATYTGATNYLVFKGVSRFGEDMYLDNVVVTGNQVSIVSLSDATSGGAWSAGSPSIASVDVSGNVYGNAVGTSIISYTNGCGSATKTMSVIGLVSAPITAVCPTLTIALSDPTPGGAWTSSTSTVATVNPATGVVTGVSAGTSAIDYSIDAGCILSTTVTVNPAPTAILGNTSLCIGIGTLFSDASGGGTWISSSPSVADIDLTSGFITSSVTGTTTITYTLPTGCLTTKLGTVNPVPALITSSGGACVTNAVNPTAFLTDVTSPGGTWSVSNNILASIVSFSGEITGKAPGALTVSYTLPTGCYTTAPYTIYPIPAAITGTMIICANASTYLSDAVVGGTWLSSSGTLATVGSGSGMVTGMSNGNPVLSYTLPTGCLAITTMTINPAPGTIVGASSVCANSSTPLSVGGLGTWSSSSPGLASVSPGPGAGGGSVTGLVPGNTVITYTLPGTGCFNTTSITVNPIPSPITGVGGVCVGSTTTLNDLTLLGTWASTAPGTAPISTTGVVSTIGTVTVPTPVTISYALSTGCQVTTQVTINPLPVAFPVNPSGSTSSYCSGTTGIDVNMTTSDPAVNYLLSVSGVPFPSSLPGTGGILDFGAQTAAGTYSVVGTYAATGCSNAMTGNPVVAINSLPNIYNVGFSGSTTPNYCDAPGAPGVDLTLSGSQAGFAYQLFVDGNPSGITFGTGSTIDFGPQPTTGNYTVIAQDPGTFCQSNMFGSVTVGKFALPTPQDVTIQDLGLSTGPGSYCASGPGVHIGLNFASTGIDYQLWDTTNVPWTLVNTVSGGNSSLDFGYQQAVVGTPHVFAVVGVNPLTSCTNNMNNYVTVIADPLPTPYALTAPDGSSYCVGSSGVRIEVTGTDNGIHYQLYNGGLAASTSMPGTTSAIDFLNNTAAGSYTVIGTDDLTGCTNTMTGSVNVNTYPVISVYDVKVNGNASGDSYCSGDAGLHVTLSNSAFNIVYYLYKNGVSMKDSLGGTGAALDYGLQTDSAAYTIIARSKLYGCTTDMNNSPVITVNTLPAIYPVVVTNGGYYCAGGTGVNIGTSFSDVGIDYQLYTGFSTKIGGTTPGSGAALDFGTFTTPGTYSITGTNRLTGCTSNMSGSANVTINPLPAVYTVTGGGSYCAGSPTGVPVGLTNSGSGINYQLYNGMAQIGIPVPGTGTTISFGSQTATGLYTVVATDAASGCTQNMAGSRVITINPLPNVYAVTGGGTYCAGSTAAHVMLGNSTTGIQYQLFNGITPVGTLPGSGSAIDFGPQGTSGGYTVTASNSITGCSSNMSGIATVVVNPLPAVQTVGGGGAYCAGTSGAHIYLTTGSQPGISYQPYIGLVAQGSPVTGTGVVLDLGPQTTAGSYTVIASDAGTGCSMKMTGSATVSINALPSAYTVSGGGTLCAGAAGYDIIQTGSATGISYQLFNSATPGSSVKTMIGTGAFLDFGAETNAGTYTVVATNSTTGCVNNMIGSGTINVNPAPDPFTVTGGGHFCTGASGVAVGLAGSIAGINYQLYNGLLPIGLPVGGTGTILNFGPQTASGTYTIVGTNTMTTCTGSMTGNAPVVADPIVTPAVSITGTDGIACIGQTVNYTTSVINGGTAPTYIWKVGTGIVSGGSSYSDIPANGDVVSVSMTSNANCASPATVTTSVKMSVIPYVIPSATISADPGNSVCNGTAVTFTASTVSGGTAPGYSWLVNGVVLPTASSTTYNYTPVDGDAVVFMLRSSERCRTADSIFSDPVSMNVDNATAPDVSVASHLGPIVNVGQLDTFTVIFNKKLVAGAAYTYQWFINGAVIVGEDRATFINHNVFNSDNVSVVVTKNGACGDQSGTAQITVMLHNLGTGNVTTTTSDIAVLPNPSKGEFNVKGTLGTSNSEELTMEITDMLGQVIYNGKVMAQNGNINEHISLKNTIANGMYLLSVHSESVNTVFHIVIEK